MNDQWNALMRKFCGFKEDHVPWIILMLGAAGLRLFHLSHYDIWYDEALSALFATIFYSTYFHSDYIAYGYYSLVRYWMELFGTSLFALRSLSVIASVLCIYPLYRFTRSYFDRKVAFIATALFVVSPFQIWYAQELRNYSLMTCESIFFVYMLWRFRQTGYVRYSIGALFLWTLGFLTDYRMVPYLLGIAVFFGRDLGRFFWVGLCVLFAIMLACISMVLSAQWEHFLQNSFWPSRPDIQDILITLHNFIFGYIRQPECNVIMLGLTGLLLTAVFLMSLRDRRVWMVKAFCFIPIIGVWMFSQFSVSFYVDRFFVVYSPAWYVLIACLMVHMRRGILKLVVVTLVCACIFFSLLLYYTGLNERKLPLESYWYRMHKGVPFKHPVAPVFEFLRDHYEAGDMIFFASSDIRPPLMYYLYKDKKTICKNDAWRVTYVTVSDFFAGQSFFGARKTKARVLSGQCLALNEGEWPKAKRYWLVSSNWHRGAGFFPRDNQTLVSEYMHEVAKCIRSYNIEGVTIDLFVRPPDKNERPRSPERPA